jgi:hypothetical protein
MLRTVVVWSEGEHAGETDAPRGWLTWMALLLWLALSTYVGLCNSLSMVLVNMAAPDKSSLGAINGISTAIQSVSAFGRCLGVKLNLPF